MLNVDYSVLSETSTFDSESESISRHLETITPRDATLIKLIRHRMEIYSNTFITQ